jgi:hypothetical protein
MLCISRVAYFQIGATPSFVSAHQNQKRSVASSKRAADLFSFSLQEGTSHPSFQSLLDFEEGRMGSNDLKSIVLFGIAACLLLAPSAGKCNFRRFSAIFVCLRRLNCRCLLVVERNPFLVYLRCACGREPKIAKLKCFTCYRRPLSWYRLP